MIILLAFIAAALAVISLALGQPKQSLRDKCCLSAGVTVITDAGCYCE